MVFKADHEQGWSLVTLPLPDKGSASLISTDDFDDRLLLSYQSFLVPTTVYLLDGKLTVIRQLPKRFDASDPVVEQFESTSKDGTHVPYFLVHPEKHGTRLEESDRSLRLRRIRDLGDTFLHGRMGKGLAGKRGCLRARQYPWRRRVGPKWHRAAMTVHRQRAYDDFASVAEDLIARKITSPRRLGIRGGSNGGLLMGVAFTERPELYHAVLCEVPLLDMLRYTQCRRAAVG